MQACRLSADLHCRGLKCGYPPHRRSSGSVCVRKVLSVRLFPWLCKKSVGRVFYAPLVAMCENIFMPSSVMYMSFSGVSEAKSQFPDTFTIFCQDTALSGCQGHVRRHQENKQVGVAVSLEYFVHCRIISMSIRKNDYSHSYTPLPVITSNIIT